MLIRRDFIGAAVGALAASGSGQAARQAASAASPFDANLISAPEEQALWPRFRADLAQWRTRKRSEIEYDDRLYRRADLQWGATSFCCGFVMLCDLEFYSPQDARYLAGSWLEKGAREFGGYDSLVLWHAYPRIGVDQRNQYDFYRDMPGGLKGLKDLFEILHGQNVKAYIDYNPWDTGTRREGKSDVDALAELVQSIDADGIFLDTMNRGAREFRSRLDAAKPGVVLEGEIALPLENVHDHHLSWAQGFRDSRTPGILRNKWFERRHMQHQIQRWNHDHTAELQAAWMNGSGVMVWENVFGSWVGWSLRDRSILRSMLPIQRHFSRLFTGESWTPLVETEAEGIYASLWEDGATRLWTLVNRTEREIRGPMLRVMVRSGDRYFDLVRGLAVAPTTKGGEVVLEGSLPPRGIGCFLARPANSSAPGDERLLRRQAARFARSDFNRVFPARKTTACAPVGIRVSAVVPAGMVAIGPVDFDGETVFRVRECGQLTSMDYEPGRGTIGIHKPVRVRRFAALRRFAIDLTPVTNAEYAKFLEETGYRPRHVDNFLKHWRGRVPPAGKERHPVVYVDLEDARAYAKWAGKRLPADLEWQYAAAGPAALLYPWGNEMIPRLCNDGANSDTTAVDSFPAGRSPFGCYDMCGNTWEWTESEHSDGRTRFAFLRGGSWFKAKGSDWYTDGGPQPGNFAMKFLLMWAGLDRCSTVGFRCALTLE